MRITRGEVQFKLAQRDTDSPILQRRSGKAPRIPQPVLAKSAPPGELFCFGDDCADPAGILETGKSMARALAAVLEHEPRLALARSFLSSIIKTYWFEAQRKYPEAWPLPKLPLPAPTSDLDPPAASLARNMGEAAARLDPITAGYLIGVTYTAMLPDETRSRLGVYYTPPGLTGRLLDMASASGIDWTTCRVIDPACGGGAFLAPVALKLAKENRSLGARQIVRAIAGRLRGLEIDPFGAWASQVFLEITVMDLCREADERLPTVVQVCNSLLAPLDQSGFDLVIGNPPYGRVTLSSQVRERYKQSLYGHANLYGLFTDLGVQMTRPGGVIAYVTPTSFLGGEYFKSLRTLIARRAPPSNIDFISVRKDVFDDVLQETLLAIYTRGNQNKKATAFTSFCPWTIIASRLSRLATLCCLRRPAILGWCLERWRRKL